MQAEDIIGYDGQNHEANYVLGSEAQVLLKEYRDQLAEHAQNIAAIIEKFSDKDTRGMEILATVHFVQKSGGENNFLKGPARG